MYTLSKDYEHLYKLLLEGNNAVGYVDYYTYRDVVEIRRTMPNKIFVGVRGTEYGNSCLPTKTPNSVEKKEFIADCKRMNLEFILP